MKSSLLCCLISSLALLTASCGKPPIDPVVPVPQPVNTPPVAHVEKNIAITIPPDFMYLYASTMDAEMNITKVSWKQISGPSQISFSNADSIQTKFSGLVPGEYAIEFTATDRGGLFDKDTTTLVASALPALTTEIIFQNQVWDCMFGCAIFIDISSLPFPRPYLTYIKEDGSSDWHLVPGPYQFSSRDQYYSFSDRTYLGIIFNSIFEPNGSPDIKIVY
ncbi:MAG TPA: hypothetical protein VFH08_03405 [Chitinophagaceae bacterium]|nr:hypothetical protein [Chitinophagaceae bacterium]